MVYRKLNIKCDSVYDDNKGLYKSDFVTKKEKRLLRVKDVLKKADLAKYGIDQIITFANHYYVELSNEWVVQIDRNGGKNIHIYEDKTEK